MSSMLFEGVSQARKDYVVTPDNPTPPKGVIPEPAFQAIVQRDPTGQKGKYVEWMCKMYVTNPEPGMFQKFGALKDFEELCKRNKIVAPDNDIQNPQYDTVEKMVNMVNQKKKVKSKSEIKASIKHKGAKKIKENDRCSIYRIKTKEASVILGANTKWCTASGSSYNYFNSYYYDRNVNLYYILPKGEMAKKYGKYAIAVYPNKRREVYDQMDKNIDHYEFRPIAKEFGFQFEEDGE
jgi:hypothetical protein